MEILCFPRARKADYGGVINKIDIALLVGADMAVMSW